MLTRWNVTEPAAEVLELWHHVDVDRDVVATVQELRADGVRCALATNQHPERAAYMRENLGYDEVFDGTEPHRRGVRRDIRAPRVPERAHLPLLPSSPGGVG